MKIARAIAMYMSILRGSNPISARLNDMIPRTLFAGVAGASYNYLIPVTDAGIPVSAGIAQ